MKKHQPQNNPFGNLSQEGVKKLGGVSGSQLVKRLTLDIVKTFSRCDPKFTCLYGDLPRRVLTEPNQGVANDSHDNENFDYIFSMYDQVRNEKRQERYIVQELIGRGTFGQVLLCRNSDGQRVAMKVVKNRKAFTNQAIIQIKILKELNKVEKLLVEETGRSFIVRLLDAFIWHNHLCLIFEYLENTLYDLLKQSQFEGLNFGWIRQWAYQILQALRITHQNNIIHCDLKPENIMFVRQTHKPNSQIKIIDYGSSCYNNEKFYSYIQSRFYRAPEVILGMAYSNKIDIWSYGCILVELYLGLPIFPGNCMYDQLRKIVNILGVPPDKVLKSSSQWQKYFIDESGIRLKTEEEYEKAEGVRLPPCKNYYRLKSLDELTNSKMLSKEEAMEHDLFIDFIKGCLQIDPERRLSADLAWKHIFIQQSIDITMKLSYPSMNGPS